MYMPIRVFTYLYNKYNCNHGVNLANTQYVELISDTEE